MHFANNDSAASKHWKRYTPDEKNPWNLKRVVHLHRRAGFGATWDEIQRDLADGPKKSIERFLTGTCRSEEGFQRMATSLKQAATGSSSNDVLLQAWWMFRMVGSPDPLTERLTLMWHNHFATSNLKVGSVAAMYWQNSIFRKHARAPFGELLSRVVHDRATLFWLDAPSNRKGHPNENLARELMELFTLGVGHYTESDVKEAARSLTGWDVSSTGFFMNSEEHDADKKTVLGRTERFDGDQLVELLLDHPATARRLAWRLCELLMGEEVVSDDALDDLAAGLRNHNLDIGWAVETILRSQVFFSEANIGMRVIGPPEFLVGAIRAFEAVQPPPSVDLLAGWSRRLGQELFYPPNVGGWSGGRKWLTSRYVVGRANFAAALVEGRLSRPRTPLDIVGLSRRHGRGEKIADSAPFFEELVLGTQLGGDSREKLLSALSEVKGTQQDIVRTFVAMLLTLPEAQLA